MGSVSKPAASRRLIQAYPSLPLRQRLTAFVAATGMTNAEATLEAIQAVRDQLRTRWAPATKAPSQLFLRSAYHHPPVEEVQQTGIRLTIDDIATIDDLAAYAGAPSRSAYVCAAWDLYLPTPAPAEPDTGTSVSEPFPVISHSQPG